MSKGWTPWGGFSRKCIRGREAFLFVVDRQDDGVFCQFVFSDDFWADSAKRAREREARKHRRSFRLVT